MPTEVLKPWLAFLREVDLALEQQVEVPFVLNEDRDVLTLELWLNEFFGAQGGSGAC